MARGFKLSGARFSALLLMGAGAHRRFRRVIDVSVVWVAMDPAAGLGLAHKASKGGGLRVRRGPGEAELYARKATSQIAPLSATRRSSELVFHLGQRP